MKKLFLFCTLIGFMTFLSAGIGKTTDLKKSSQTEFVTQTATLSNVLFVLPVATVTTNSGNLETNIPTKAVKKFSKEKRTKTKAAKKEVPIQKRE